jgi:hypothetical protein
MNGTILMSPRLKACENRVLKLPVGERAFLVAHLIESLDVLNDEENERLWMEEAHHRYQEYRKGRVSTKPAAEAIRDARAHIK